MDARKPLHLLCVTGSRTHFTGADRDLATLLGALDPQRYEVSWVGVEGTATLRSHVELPIVRGWLDAGHPLFDYVFHENAVRRRSPWLWTRIIGDHVNRLRRPLARLRTFLKDWPVDLVLSNPAPVTLGILYAQLARCPHVWLVKECLDQHRPACRLYTRWISLASRSVVVPSRACALQFPRPVHVFPDGNRLEEIDRGVLRSRPEVLGELALPAGRPVVAQIGGLVSLKGQHVTLGAVNTLAASCAEPGFSLLFLGGGEGPYREELTRQIEQLPRAWQEAIRFVSFRPDDFSLIAAADIVLQPSTLADTWPNAVREAMLLGKPVIGSRIGGIPELIEDGETGMLVEPEQPKQLAVAIATLVTNVPLRQTLASNAHRFARERFDIRRCVNVFDQLFQTVAGVDPWAERSVS